MVVTQHARWAAMIRHSRILADGVGNVPFKSQALIRFAEDVVGRGGYDAGVRHRRGVFVAGHCCVSLECVVGRCLRKILNLLSFRDGCTHIRRRHVP